MRHQIILSEPSLTHHIDATFLLMQHRTSLFPLLGLGSYQNKNVGPECFVRDSLHELMGGRKEVKTPYGAIDLLTDSTLYEVKKVEGWKGAIGQALMYSEFYPNHNRVVYLFGSDTPKNWKQMCASAAKYKIALLFEVYDKHNAALGKPVKPATKQDYVNALQILGPHCDNPIIDSFYEQIEVAFWGILSDEEFTAVQSALAMAAEEIQQQDLRGNASCEQACTKASRIVATAIVQNRRR